MAKKFDPRLTIDDIIVFHLNEKQIKLAFMTAYGKYTANQASSILDVHSETILKWKRDCYFKLLVQHIRRMEYYQNIKEYASIQKATIASYNVMLQKAIVEKDLDLIKEVTDRIHETLLIFKP